MRRNDLTKWRERARGRDGFNLVEVMVAVVIITGAVLVLANVLLIGASQVGGLALKEKALNVAHTQLQAVQARSYSEVALNNQVSEATAKEEPHGLPSYKTEEPKDFSSNELPKPAKAGGGVDAVDESVGEVAPETKPMVEYTYIYHPSSSSVCESECKDVTVKLVWRERNGTFAHVSLRTLVSEKGKAKEAETELIPSDLPKLNPLFSSVDAIGGAEDIIKGPDGNVWFDTNSVPSGYGGESGTHQGQCLGEFSNGGCYEIGEVKVNEADKVSLKGNLKRTYGALGYFGLGDGEKIWLSLGSGAVYFNPSNPNPASSSYSQWAQTAFSTGSGVHPIAHCGTNLWTLRSYEHFGNPYTMLAGAYDFPANKSSGNNYSQLTENFPLAQDETPGVAEPQPSDVICDGNNLWVMKSGTGEISELATASPVGFQVGASQGGTVVGAYNVPACGYGAGGECPRHGVLGSDGNLYFTESSGAVGELNLTTHAFKNFPLPSYGPDQESLCTPGASPNYITNGPEGNVYFTESGTSCIGVLDSKSGEIREYRVPQKDMHGGQVEKIAVSGGGEGAVYFTEGPGIDYLGKMTLYADPPRSLSCASEKICIGGDSAGGILASKKPAEGANSWTGPVAVDCYDYTSEVLGQVCTGSTASVHKNYPGINAISCPSEGFCAAVDNHGNVLISSNPAGGESAWKTVPVDCLNVSTNKECSSGESGSEIKERYYIPLTGIDCPSTSFCVAVDARGDALTSNAPTDVSATWNLVATGVSSLTSIACSGESYCIASGPSSQFVVTTKPKVDKNGAGPGGEAEWHTPPFQEGADGPNGYGDSLTCPNSELCVSSSTEYAQGGYEDVQTSSSPATAASWTYRLRRGPGPYSGGPVACTPSASFCAAAEALGEVSTVYGSGGPNFAIDAGHAITGLSCPSASLCVALDEDGKVLTSTEPFKASSWESGTIVPVTPQGGGPPPLISGTDAVGAHLTTTTGTFAGSSPVYEYQWEDCGASGASCSPISGATSSSYTLASSDAGQRVRVYVTVNKVLEVSAPTSLVLAAPVAASSGATITEYPTASKHSGPFGITKGINGNVLFAEEIRSGYGELETAENSPNPLSVKELGSAGSEQCPEHPFYLASGPPYQLPVSYYGRASAAPGPWPWPMPASVTEHDGYEGIQGTWPWNPPPTYLNNFNYGIHGYAGLPCQGEAELTSGENSEIPGVPGTWSSGTELDLYIPSSTESSALVYKEANGGMTTPITCHNWLWGTSATQNSLSAIDVGYNNISLPGDDDDFAPESSTFGFGPFANPVRSVCGSSGSENAKVWTTDSGDGTVALTEVTGTQSGNAGRVTGTTVEYPTPNTLQAGVLISGCVPAWSREYGFLFKDDCHGGGDIYHWEICNSEGGSCHSAPKKQSHEGTFNTETVDVGKTLRLTITNGQNTEETRHSEPYGPIVAQGASTAKPLPQTYNANNAFISATNGTIDQPTSGDVGVPYGIVKDGSKIYFTEETGNKIGELNPATGTITEYPIETLDSDPLDLTVGPDGNIWFAENSGNKIGEFNVGSHTFSEYTVPTPSSGPLSIFSDESNHKLYFTEYMASQIGQVNLGAEGPVISGTPAQGNTLHASDGIWSGGTPESYSYQWCTSGVGNGSRGECPENYSEISGATASSYTLTSEDVVEQKLAVCVSVSNVAGSAGPECSVSPTVTLGKPVARTPNPVVSGGTVVGEAVHTTNGTYGGGIPSSFSYQWQDCDSKGESCSNISGATSSSYTLVSADATSHNLSFHGEAQEGSDVITHVSSFTGLGSGYPISSAYLPEGTTITDVNESADKITVSNNALATANLEHGIFWVPRNSLRAVVEACNSAGCALEDSSVYGPISSGPPLLQAAPVISGVPNVGQTLSTDGGSWSGAAPISYSYQWQDCTTLSGCVSILGATGTEYTVQSSDIGDQIQVVATATNADGSAAASSSESRKVFAAACENGFIGSEGGNWSTATNWYTGEVPSESETACVDPGNLAAVTTPESVGSVLGGNVEVARGELKIATPGAASSLETLTLIEEGNLDVEGNLTVAAAFNWTPQFGAGALTGNGSLTIANGATSNFQDTFYYCEKMPVSELSFINDGTTHLNGNWEDETTVELLSGAQFVNNGKLVVTTEDGGGFCGSPASVRSSDHTGTIANNGVIVKEAGSGTGAIEVPLSGDGEVKAESGTLQISGGGENSNSTWSAANGARILLENFSFAGTSSWEGPGGFTVEGEITVPNGAVLRSSAPVSFLNYAWLNLGGKAEFNKSLSWEGTYSSHPFAGAGELVIGHSATGIIGTNTYYCETFSLEETKLVNNGALNIDGNPYVAGDFNLSKGAGIENNGVLNVNLSNEGVGGGGCGNNPSVESSDHTGSIVNNGTLRKAENNAPTRISVPVANNDAVSNLVGSLSFSAGTGVATQCSAGSWENSGSALRFESGDFYIGSSVDLSAVGVGSGATVTRCGAPVNLAPPNIVGNDSVGHTLSAHHGEWRGTEPIIYTFQWKRCNAEGAECEAIVEAEAESYTVQSADSGHLLRVLATATNSAGSASSESEAYQPTAYQGLVSETQPTEWWRLNELSDTGWANSGSDSAALVGSGVTGGAEGIPGDAPGGASLTIPASGVSHYPEAAVSATIHGTYTVEAWVKPASLGSCSSSNYAGCAELLSTRIGTASEGPDDTSYDLSIGDNGVHSDIGEGTSYHGCGSGWLTTSADAAYSFSVEHWYQVVEVVTPSNYTFYVDGSEVGNGGFGNGCEGSYPPLLMDSHHPVTLGAYHALGSNEYQAKFTGGLSNVALYQGTLTSAQIREAYETGN